MRRLIGIIGLLLVVVSLAPVSCSPASVKEAPSIGLTAPVPAQMPPGGIAREGVMDYEYSSPGASSSVAPKQAPPQVIITTGLQSSDRMIVRTGNMALVVEDVPVAIEQITSMADRFTGYVVSSNVWQDRERLFGSISVRVPAERFDDAVRALRALAVDVTSETSNSRDVTEEYTDLSARLKNLEATEQQLLKILEKAVTVQDILDVQRELSNTRDQIEQTKGRMQYLERTSATSIIDVTLQQSKLNLDFNANKTTVKEGENIFFSADISGGFAPYSYQWDLGDKTTSTESGFAHVYKNDGKYTVTLTVTDDHGKNITKTRTDYITVIPGWSAGNTVSSAGNGLAVFGHALASIFIWLGFFSPVWLVIGGIFYWWWRRRRKRAS